MMNSIRSRFMIIGLFFILWMGGAVAVSLTQITAVSGDLATVSRFVTPVKDSLHALQSHHLALENLLAHYIRAMQTTQGADSSTTGGLLTEIRATQQTLKEQLDLARKVAAQGLGDRAGAVSADVLDQTIADLRVFDSQLRTLSLGIDRILSPAARDPGQIHDQGLSMRDEHRLLSERLRGAIIRLGTHSREVVNTVGDRGNMLVQVEVILLVVASLSGLLLAAHFARTLKKAVRGVITGTQAVADGDLQVQLADEGQGGAEFEKMAQSFNHMVRELRLSRHVLERFGKQIDPKVVRNLITEETALDRSEKRVMTVSVTSLTGFDHLAENWSPELLQEFLIDYFNAMTDPVIRQKGIVDSIASDQMVSFWGPPFCGEASHGKSACAAALDQQARFENLRRKYADQLPGYEFGLRIGIATGQVVVGSMGAEKNQFYTVVGNCVNYASRLEKANRIYRTQILVSRETVDVLGDAFLTRDLDRVALLGADRPAHFHQLICLNGDAEPGRVKQIAVFEKALSHYRLGEFDAAIPLFKQLIDPPGDAPETLAPDFVPQLFLNRMERLSRREQSRAWDGIWVIKDPYERRDVDG